jgi:hypothetical protein
MRGGRGAVGLARPAARTGAVALGLALVVGCALERRPLVERGATDAGMDAARALDAGPEDALVPPDDAAEDDAPVAPPDVPDPCPACPTGTRCDTSGACVCDGTLCAAFGECVGEVCEPCGTIDARCCAGDRCAPGGRCMGGTCSVAGGACGRLGQPCCMGVTCEDTGAECIGGVCTPGGTCGGADEVCCLGGACVTGQLCRPDFLGPDRCRPCGGLAEPCCPVGPACRSGSCLDIFLVGRICSV